MVRSLKGDRMNGKALISALSNGLKLVGINLIIVLVLLELVSLGFYASQHRQFFYSRQDGDPETADDRAPARNRQDLRLEEDITEILHPYFGYISKPGTGFGGFEFQSVFQANNYGLVSRVDYPYRRENENQFLIGIFGGSVATFYYMNEVENPTLERSLKQLPNYADKEIVLLNFSQGGYKQPQQLLLLNYFLSQGQELDMAINIDGFNEVAIASRNRKKDINFSMPSSFQLLPLAQLANNNLSIEQMEVMLEVLNTKEHLKQTIATQQTCGFALCYYLQDIRYYFALQAYYHHLEEFEEKRKESGNSNDSLVYIQTTANLAEEESYEQMSDFWANASLAMASVLKQRNIPYFHILQPNQYYPTERKFSEEEQERFAPENNRKNPYIEGVELGYPYLLDRSTILLDNDVNFFNGTTSLDAQTDTVYIDTCCHYNQTGRNVFANYVASQIVFSLTDFNPKDNVQN
ncbi:hypothetical protein [Roseofilum casamattae]|uniref:SGNH/GDSL hydrolase family protein n=1 Tax=Roseofilum casamattae BLCC-M143 TaxID=3022442 RepID=A0ABT7BZ12_9CYAN|nr:hypothetical protein [Roseofilum casamattae]MDJ1184443.1 hypothetical protein [Roseofilum casamattae BLCC-M143]